MKKILCLVLVLIFVISATITVSATEQTKVEPDYSKFKWEFDQRVKYLRDGERAPAIMALKKDKIDEPENYSDEQLDEIYKQREADTYAFLERHPELSGEEEILFVSKYSKRVLINATKDDFESLSADPDVVAISHFFPDLGPYESGFNGVILYSALEEYLKSIRAIDYADPRLRLADERYGIPMVKYLIEPIVDEPTTIRIDDHIFGSDYTNACYPIGFFALIDGTLVPLEEACKNGYIEDISKVANCFGGSYVIKNLGDMDGNGELNIIDVTLLQMGLAHLIEMPKITIDWGTFKDIDVTDYNNDGDLNILDATAMQMSIAKYE